MSLTPGTRLGVYEITAQIGEGGMGQVFRATDTKLKRQVAIKILPPAVAADAERLARFQREAQVLASLNHPNIAAIYGLEESGGMTALVMELVEGDDLSQRITRGAVPIDEALPIAKQIAEALEAAHEQGIIHRDLKPANIKVRGDGTVKVLDFGLAKAMEPAAGSSPSMSMSPTITTPAMTQAGMILGTAAYMSPEQAKGRTVDRRADVWAFGAVLYEMLTGKRAFGGDDISDTLANVLKVEPDWNRLPADVSPWVRLALRACLQKDPKQRLGDVQSVRLALEGVFETTAPRTTATQSSSRGRLVWMALAAVAVLGMVTVAVTVASLSRGTEPPGPPTMQFEVEHPVTNGENQIAISLDGSHFTSLTASRSLWVRALQQPDGQLLKGTENANDPFWSPDGRLIGFVADGKLKTIDISGGPPRVLSDAASYGGAWNKDGTILFAHDVAGPLSRIAASGGTPAPVTVLDTSRDETAHVRPYFLPDGTHFIFLARSTKLENNAIFLGSLESKDRKLLVPSLVAAVFAPPRHLLFVRDNTLLAQEVDPSSFAPIGAPAPVAEDVANNSGNSRVGVAVSGNGVLVYRHLVFGLRQLMWFSRSGSAPPQVQSAIDYVNPALAPDGQRFVGVRAPSSRSEQLDLWIQDIVRKTESRFTSDPGDDTNAMWSSDGQQIVFRSARDGGIGNLYLKSSGGVRPEELLLKTNFDKVPTDWSADGRYIIYSEANPKTRGDIWLLPVSGDRKPVAVIQGDFNETNGRLSPDGRWMAYQSDETGSDEIYVQTMPSSGNRWKISNGGGVDPKWNRDGKELFYGAGNVGVMAVELRARSTSNQIEVSEPHLVLRAAVSGYDVSADGQRFLVDARTVEGQNASSQVTFLLNFFDDLLRRKVPVGK